MNAEKWIYTVMIIVISVGYLITNQYFWLHIGNDVQHFYLNTFSTVSVSV